MPELGENREDAAGSLNSVYRPSWLLLPACNLFFWVYPRVVSMSMPNYFIVSSLVDILSFLQLFLRMTRADPIKARACLRVDL